MPSSVEDLSAIARRRTLTLPEARRLDLALKSSVDSRILHDAGCDYDTLSAERPDDTELVERLARRAAERFSGRAAVHERIGSARRRHVAPLVVAVLFCGAMAAAAGTWGVRSLGGPAPLPAPLLRTPTAGRAPVPSLPGPERVARIEEIPPSSRAAPPAVRSPTPRSGSGDARTPAGAASFPEDDAASLFAAANAERKLGNVAGALRSYEELERRFPNAAEARLSHVLVARLLLRRGDFAGGLAHFDSYLAADRNGTLVEEALQGRAQALRALGRTTEERQALRDLVERFPNSIQARAAKERLATPP